MKNVFFFISICCFSAHSQVGIGTTTPDSSSILHLESSDSGFLVPRLTELEKNSIASPAVGLLIYQINNGNGFWYYDGSVWRSFLGGEIYVFENGLYEESGIVKLGGVLIEDTEINLDDNDLTIAAGMGGYLGNLFIEGSSRTVLETNLEDDYVSFGGGYPGVDGDDGTTFNDSGNATYTKDFIAGFYKGESGGSAIGLGSIEYMVDGTSELFLDLSALSPMENLEADLGAGSPYQSGPVRNWDDVYAEDFVATSGEIYNIAADEEQRGLKEIMQLKPIVYREAEREIGGRVSTIDERDLRLGFLIDDLLDFIPEAVKTSDWYVLKEGEVPVKKTIENPTGIMYNQIIPVLVNAIQEQQKQIDALKERSRQ